MIEIIEGKRHLLLKEFKSYEEAQKGFIFYRDLTENSTVVVAESELTHKWGMYIRVRDFGA